MSLEKTLQYPSFPYPGSDLVKYLFTSGVFTILLNDGSIIHYEPEDIASFEDWLKRCRIPNMRNSDSN